MSVRKNNIQI